MSVTLPKDVQERVMRSIKGLEDVTIVRPGYGVEVCRYSFLLLVVGVKLTRLSWYHAVRLCRSERAQE